MIELFAMQLLPIKDETKLLHSTANCIFFTPVPFAAYLLKHIVLCLNQSNNI